MSAVATVNRRRTSPGTSVVDCALCGRRGRWSWQANTVAHLDGYGRVLVCLLSPPGSTRKAMAA